MRIAPALAVLIWVSPMTSAAAFGQSLSDCGYVRTLDDVRIAFAAHGARLELRSRDRRGGAVAVSAVAAVVVEGRAERVALIAQRDGFLTGAASAPPRPGSRVLVNIQLADGRRGRLRFPIRGDDAACPH